jgi:hypothetical protein
MIRHPAGSLAGRARLTHDGNNEAMVGNWAAYRVLACLISLLSAAICSSTHTATSGR